MENHHGAVLIVDGCLYGGNGVNRFRLITQIDAYRPVSRIANGQYGQIKAGSGQIPGSTADTTVTCSMASKVLPVASGKDSRAQ